MSEIELKARLPEWTAYACRVCHRLPYVTKRIAYEDGGCAGNCGHPRDDSLHGRLNALVEMGRTLGIYTMRENVGDTVQVLRIRCDELLESALVALQAQPAEGGVLDFDLFRKANVARCVKWHPEGISSWSPSDWLVAAMGELGELASEVKTFNRERDGLAGNKQQFTPEERKLRMANEAADVVTYLDLFCAERGIDLGAAIVRKFNEVSERVGFPDRIILPATTTGGGGVVLSAAERKALEGVMANSEHEAGDTDDACPDIEDDEDAYWAWNTYHGLRKLLAAPKPATTTGEGE